MMPGIKFSLSNLWIFALAFDSSLSNLAQFPFVIIISSPRETLYVEIVLDIGP